VQLGKEFNEEFIAGGCSDYISKPFEQDIMRFKRKTLIIINKRGKK
jgi:hypothetical protein